MNTVQLCLVVVLMLTSATRYVNALTYRELLELPEDDVEDIIKTFEDISEDDVADDVDTMVIRDFDADVDERYMYLMYTLAGEMMESGEMEGVGLQGPCSCHKCQCTCCASKKFTVKIIIKKFRKRLVVCVQVSYLPAAYGFKLVLQFNRHTMYAKEISLTNPPALCYPVPGFGKLARVCAQIYNVNLADKSLCVRAVGVVDLKLKKFQVHLKIACFRIPIMDEINKLPVMRKENIRELTQEVYEDSEFN